MDTHQAAYVSAFNADDPLAGLTVGDRPVPAAPPGWELVEIRAASVNHHDLWTLKGIRSVPFEPPVTLGTDGAGVTKEGREVVIHSVLGRGDQQRLLSDGVDGTFGQYVAAPAENLFAKPTDLSWAEAACLPTAWLTAWRMLFRTARALPGERILVQGATGGLSSAAIQLGVSAGLHVTATSRSAAGQEWATELGAHDVVPSGARLPHRVDVVIDSVGEATAEHSQRSLNAGGRWVVAGGTSGMRAAVDIGRLFWRELQITGVTMGSIEDLGNLIAFLQRSGLRPRIGQTYQGIENVPAALASVLDGSARGKLVVEL